MQPLLYSKLWYELYLSFTAECLSSSIIDRGLNCIEFLSGKRDLQHIPRWKLNTTSN